MVGVVEREFRRVGTGGAGGVCAAHWEMAWGGGVGLVVVVVVVERVCGGGDAWHVGFCVHGLLKGEVAAEGKRELTLFRCYFLRSGW